MGSQDFFFAIGCFSRDAPVSIVEDLAANIFRHVGCAPEHAEGLNEALARAARAASSDGGRRCDVQFKARNGTLEVLVTSNGGRIWQADILIP